jgi:hypothetical protein
VRVRLLNLSRQAYEKESLRCRQTASSPFAENLSFANIPSARNQLTQGGMVRKNRDTCRPFSCLSSDSSNFS